MTEWTKQRHADARTLSKGSGTKNSELRAALDEIERLEAELGDRDKRIEEFESRRHDEAKSFIADLSKLRQRIEELEAERDKLLADLQYMIKQDAEGPGNLDGYRELSEKAQKQELRAEKAEAERDKCKERIEEVEKWNSTLYKERNLALCERDKLQATLSIDPILIWVSAELVEATRKFDKFNSTHEGYAVILEELDELWSCVKKNMTDVELRKEAVQVAAMAVRFIMDCTDKELVCKTCRDMGEIDSFVLDDVFTIPCPDCGGTDEEKGD